MPPDNIPETNDREHQRRDRAEAMIAVPTSG
jgi:hypothetical protein